MVEHNTTSTNNPTISATYDFPCSNDLGTSVDENRPYCRALYNFQGEYENELSFLAGEIIYLTAKMNEEWLEGESQTNGFTGIFPASFVEVVVDLEPVPSSDPDNTPNQNTMHNLSTSGVASVLHDFTGRYEDELSAKAGDSLKVVEIIDENWVRCQNLANNEVGIVPQGFLQIFLDNERSSFIANNATFRNSEEVKEVDWNEEVINWQTKPRESPRLPAVQPFNVLDFEAFDVGQVKKRKQAPSRPPPPKDVSPEKQGSPRKSNGPKNESNNDLVRSFPPTSQPLNTGAGVLKSNGTDVKEKVVQDLLSTEITYLFDLDACNLLLDDTNKQILTNGLPLLKALSQKLIDNLNFEKSKPPELQCYGQMFMEMKEQFFSTFSCHCRCVEQISQILENNVDSSLQEALNKCFCVKTNSTMFKIPLYVGELLKNTAINHIDHPKLMESLKQLGNLASKMNECKRRKELIKKYKGNQQLTLAERISRINMHSLVKKSNRLKYRISSTMGLNNIKDSEFDYLISLLDAAERRVCKLLYCAQLYKKNVEFSLKKNEESYKGVCPPQDEEALKAFAKMFRTLDKIAKEYVQMFEVSIINEGKQLVRRDYTKLIHKRCDKLADYENAMAINRNSEEVEMRRNEYEALNNQVKGNLPKLVSTINKKVVDLIHKIHAFDEQFLRRMDTWFRQERAEKIRRLTPNAQPFEYFFTMVQKQRFVEIDKLLRFKTGLEQKPSVSNRTSFRASLRLGRKSPALTMGSRTQTVKERDALIKIMKAQGRVQDLRKVRLEYTTDNMRLAANDIVIIKEHKAGSCLCDNGVVLDYVPLDYLLPYDDTFYPSYRPTSLPAFIELGQSSANAKNGKASSPSVQASHQFSSLIEPKPAARDQKKPQVNDNLIGMENIFEKNILHLQTVFRLEESLIDLSSPEKQPVTSGASKPVYMLGQSSEDPLEDVFKLVQYDQEPRSARVDFRSNVPNSQFSSQLTQPSTTSSQPDFYASSKEDPFAELFRSAINTPLSKIKRESPAPEIPRRPDSSESPLPSIEPSKEEAASIPLIPVRLAPLPPLPQAVQMAELSTPPKDQFKAGYDFSPEGQDNNQIGICEGEALEVIQRHDDAGNGEWWMVRKRDGRSGYVPAAYLLQS
uniref:SH3 domain-containing protein n=1 Tax=Ditylenchus dipsaci TaxID=166011 RepID=A0A915E1K9_9BILA